MSPRTRLAGVLAALCVAAIVVALDQGSKAIVEAEIQRGERVEVLPFLDFVHVLNRGVAFGFLGDGSKGLVVAVTLLALAAVLIWFAVDPRRPWAWLAVGMLAGGAAGNLIDRLTGEAVVDFIDFPAWPSFNLADTFITLGAVVLVLSALTSGARSGREAEAEGADAR